MGAETAILLVGGLICLFSLGSLWFSARIYKEAVANRPKSLRGEFDRLIADVDAQLLAWRKDMNALAEDIVDEREKSAHEKKKLQMERARQARREQQTQDQAHPMEELDDLAAIRQRAREQGIRLT